VHIFEIPEVEKLLREKSQRNLDKSQKTKMHTFLQNYEYFCTSEEEFFPDIYNSAFEIAKKVEHAKYPSDKLKLLKDAFT